MCVRVQGHDAPRPAKPTSSLTPTNVCVRVCVRMFPLQVAWETRKIFGYQHMDISCTAVRVPTLRAHAEAITIETHLDVTPEEAR